MLVDCQMGQILVAGRLDPRLASVWRAERRPDSGAFLSDVGRAIKVALQLGAPRFYDTIRTFGIGQLTGIELPGENRRAAAAA